MEKQCFAYRSYLARTGLACALSLSALVVSPHASAQESIVNKELNRRVNNARKAYELLNTGDQAYKKKRL